MIKRLVLAAAVFLTPLAAFAWDQKPNQPVAACAAQVPYGAPTLTKPNTVVECHTAYILQHDNAAKIPAWVAYTLTPQHAIGCVARSNAFVADAILPKGQRSELNDYAKSGFDQGHLANDAEMSWDQQVEYESFLMSNMSPQYPALNRGIWKLLESYVRAWSYGNNTSYTVYAGDIYTASSKTIGDDKVVVPDALYKIVINDTTKEVQAYRFANITANQGNDLTPMLTTVAALEKETGITFPVPPGTDKNKKAAAPWPVDLKKTADAKKAQCKGAPGTDD